MKLLIKNVQLVGQGWGGKKTNILIEKGVITKIGKVDTKVDKVIEHKGLFASIGWFDMRSHFTDPGEEFKEDLDSGRATAAAGGYTGVALLPNTSPVVQSKNGIKYLTKENGHQVTDIYPLAAVTLEAKGEELTEMLDLHHAGAVGYTDGLNSLWNTDILLKALQYLQKNKSLLINRAEDKWLTRGGSMNESATSTMMGLRGMPAIAEDIMIARDLRLLEYAGGRLHFSNVSTAAALKLIKEGKKKGLEVSCDVSTLHLMFDDEALSDFDTNYKINPPLRTKTDVKALWKGIEDGTVDAVITNHIPQDEENKKLEFDLAAFGAIGLQTTLHVLKKLDNWDRFVSLISETPRTLLGLSVPQIKEGEKANLALFLPKEKWELNKKTSFSKAENSPFWNKELEGRVMATINGENHWIA